MQSGIYIRLALKCLSKNYNEYLGNIFLFFFFCIISRISQILFVALCSGVTYNEDQRTTWVQ